MDFNFFCTRGEREREREKEGNVKRQLDTWYNWGALHPKKNCWFFYLKKLAFLRFSLLLGRVSVNRESFCQLVDTPRLRKEKEEEEEEGDSPVVRALKPNRDNSWRGTINQMQSTHFKTNTTTHARQLLQKSWKLHTQVHYNDIGTCSRRSLLHVLWPVNIEEEEGEEEEEIGWLTSTTNPICISGSIFFFWGTKFFHTTVKFLK